MQFQYRTLLLAACFIAPTLAKAQLAKVTAWGQHHGGRTVYSYQVQNLGSRPIKQILIGHYPPTESGDGRAELSIEPIGERTSFWLTPDGARHPEGWGALLVFPQESETFYIRWTEAGYFRKYWPGAASHPDVPMPSPAGNPGILPGATESGFAAILPSDDFAYVKGHATIKFDDESINIPLVAGDPIAPSLSLQVQRINQNTAKGEWAFFSVDYSISDNYDPAPRAALEVLPSTSVGKDDIVIEKNASKAWNIRLKNVPGTSYTFRLTGVDASGNLSVKEYAYSVNAPR